MALKRCCDDSFDPFPGGSAVVIAGPDRAALLERQRYRHRSFTPLVINAALLCLWLKPLGLIPGDFPAGPPILRPGRKAWLYLAAIGIALATIVAVMGIDFNRENRAFLYAAPEVVFCLALSLGNFRSRLQPAAGSTIIR